MLLVVELHGLTVSDLLKELLYSGAPEWCGSYHHLVQNDPH